MYNQETKEKFILLRAQGYSYRKISEELGVDKNTLLKWGRDAELEVIKKRYELADELAERYKALRDEYFNKLLEEWRRVNQEIGERDLRAVEFRDLIKYRESIEARIAGFLEGHQLEERAILEAQEQSEFDSPLIFSTIAHYYRIKEEKRKTKAQAKQLINLLESFF